MFTLHMHVFDAIIVGICLLAIIGFVLYFIAVVAWAYIKEFFGKFKKKEDKDVSSV